MLPISLHIAELIRQEQTVNATKNAEARAGHTTHTLNNAPISTPPAVGGIWSSASGDLEFYQLLKFGALYGNESPLG